MLSKSDLSGYYLRMQKIEFKWLRNTLLLALLVACWVTAVHFEIDLVNLYHASIFLNTDVARVYMKNEPYGRYFYGPISLVLIKPLGLMSWTVVKYLWIALQTICFVAFWRLLYKVYPFLIEKKSHWFWVVILIVAINPIHNNFQSNNIQLMLAAVLLLSETWSWEKNQKAFWGGVLVSVAAMIKVFPAFIAVYYFLVKPTKVKAGVVAGVLISLILPFIVFGIHDAQILYRGFFEHLFTYNNEENSFVKNQDILCLPSLIARLFIDSGEKTASLINKGAILLISGVFFLASIKASRDQWDRKTSLRYLALAWALMALLNPSTRPHYFIFYIPAFAVLLEVIREHTATLWVKAVTVLSVILIAFTAQGVVGKQLNDQLEALSFPTWGMIILCIGVAGLMMSKPTKNLPA